MTTSKISRANRMGKGNVTGVKQSLLSRTRSRLGITEQPTATTTRSPAPSAPVTKPKPKQPKKTITIPAKRPAGISDKAWSIITGSKV
jgi:hypothetical protein